MQKPLDILDVVDLVPTTATVEVAGKAVRVSGIDFGDIIALFLRFPEIKAAFDRDSGGGVSIDTDRISALGPAAAGAIIAAATGHSGDEAAEASLARLPAGLQFEIIAKIAEIMFPNGPGPAVVLLQKAYAAAVATGLRLDGNSPSPQPGSSATETTAGKT